MPVAVPATDALAGRSVVAVSAGSFHSLALCSDGTVAAWGNNGYGQLGNNSTTQSNAPVAVTATGVLSGKTVVAVAAGDYHSVALCSDGTVAAWGSNDLGQLGNNSTTRSNVPVVVVTSGVLSGKTVVAVAAGYYHSVALCSDGTVAAWGSNDSGQLGNNITTSSNVPVAVTATGVLSGKTVVAVSAGSYHSVALCSDGTMAAWGSNGSGQLGNNSAIWASNVPVKVTTNGVLEGKKVSAISTGASHSLALCSDGTLAAWGWNVTGQLGNNNTTDSSVPVAVTATGVLAGKTVIAVSAGVSHSVALCSDGTLTAWGNNSSGQLGNNNTTQSNVPVAVTATSVLLGKKVVTVTTGSSHSMALCEDGTLAAWGSNFNGQLGNNSNSYSTIPELGVLADKTVVAVSAGYSHSIVLCSNGTLASWGDNNYGQLGNNSTTASYIPIAVTATGVLAGKTVVAVSAGGNHSVALCSDGTLAAWGWNSSGQLGNNSTTDSTVPVAVMATGVLAGKTVVAVSAGYSHSVALCSDGTLAAWGNNGYGQLGNNSTTQSAVPVAVTATGLLSDKTVVAISAGHSHSVALCSDSTLAAWGTNRYGQLGNNSMTDSNVPVAVTTNGVLSGKTLVAVESGVSQNVVLCSDGTVATWGNHNSDQLGNSNTIESTIPVIVEATGALSGKSVLAVSAGGAHSMALCSDGTLAAWGYNNYGQLGNNSTTNSRVPVAVSTSALRLGERFTQASSGQSATHTLALVALPPWAIMQISGNSLPIANADSTPAIEDGTDFGRAALLNTQTTHNFTLSNLGGAPLHLTGQDSIQFSGDAAADFTVTTQPNSSLALGESTTFTITFDPHSSGWRQATVTITNNSPEASPYTFAISGFGALTTLRPQTITFSPPARIFLNQSPISLTATATSGLQVTLTRVSGPARLVGNNLTLTGVGTVKLTASQSGGSNYAAAATVTKSIVVTANPTTLTLINLAQTYDGNPKPISTLGGTSPVITYSINGVYGSTAPTNAGSYPVRVVDGTAPKTGTLVIAKAVLTVRPDDQRKFVGQPKPPLTYNITGFKGTDTSAVLIKAPVLTTPATAASVGGIYAITATAATALNYSFNYQPGSMVVEGFAGTYETLLLDATARPGAKLSITVPTSSKTFTAKLKTGTHTSAVSFTGNLISNLGEETTRGIATTNILVNKVKIPYVIDFTLPLFGDMTASATRASVPLGIPSNGRKLLILAPGKTVNYAGAHTAVLEPATPAGATVPPGAGWATASVSTTGVMTLAGKLGDGTSFTSTLSPDNQDNPVYRLFVQPYFTARATRIESYLAGAITLAAHPNPTSNASLVNRRYVDQVGLTWKKTGLTADASYSAGFGPVNTVLMLDPWLPPTAAKAATRTTPAIPAMTLANRLGLIGPNISFGVNHSPSGSAADANLPTRLNLSPTNQVSVVTPVTNTLWRTLTLVPSTGTFTGSFELSDVVADKTIKRPVTFSGVLRQPALSSDDLIGDGQYVLPPLTGTEKTTGEIMFTRP